MSRDLVRFLFQLLNRDKDRRAANRSRATAECADAILHNARVSVDHSHVVDVDAELISSNLREGSFLSLAMRRGAGQHGHFAGRFDTYCRTLPATGRHRLGWTKRADLHVRREADADQASFFARLPLLFTKIRVAGNVLCLLQRGFIIATVVVETGRRVERKRAWGSEVFATYFRGIHAEIGGNKIERALNDISCFRTSRAAISVGRHL